MTWTVAQKVYARSDKGKLARKRYQESEKGIAARKRYMQKRNAKLAVTKKEKLPETSKPQLTQEPVKVVGLGNK